MARANWMRCFSPPEKRLVGAAEETADSRHAGGSGDGRAIVELRFGAREGEPAKLDHFLGGEGEVERGFLKENGARRAMSSDERVSGRAFSKKISPSSGRRSPARTEMSVDLPAPFGPISAVTRPGVTATETPSRRRFLPTRTDMSVARITATSSGA